MQGYIKPITVKVVKYRMSYPSDIPLQVPLVVIGYDKKHLVITDERVVKTYKVLWKDIELVTSEKIIQVPITQQGSDIKIVHRSKTRKSLFSSKTKF